MKTLKIRFDEMELAEAKFYKEDGFDLLLSVKWNRQFEELFDLKNSFRYPAILVSCTADGEIMDMSIENMIGTFDLIFLTEEEKSDILFFLNKNDIIFEHAEMNEFEIAGGNDNENFNYSNC
jgi:hypothetical protein